MVSTSWQEIGSAGRTEAANLTPDTITKENGPKVQLVDCKALTEMNDPLYPCLIDLAMRLFKEVTLSMFYEAYEIKRTLFCVIWSDRILK